MHALSAPLLRSRTLRCARCAAPLRLCLDRPAGAVAFDGGPRDGGVYRETRSVVVSSPGGRPGAPRGGGRCRRRDGRACPRRAGRRRRCTSPGQSGRQSGAIGSASWSASRTGVSRSSSWWSFSRSDVGLVRRRAAAGRWRGRVTAGTPPGIGHPTGNATSRRQRLHCSASAAWRSALARIPRLVRTRRTRPSIGSASDRSSPRSIRTSSTS